MLDPTGIEAFVLVAEHRSFTRAARVLNTTQAAVSLRVRRLEERLGERLLERTPRQVRLSTSGEAFLAAARDLVAAHRRAEGALVRERPRLALGVTHHIVGHDLAVQLRRIGVAVADVTLDLRVAETRALLDLYDAGTLDAVLVLRHDESRRDGEVLAQERFAWFAAPDIDVPSDTPVPLALQSEPCQIRALAVRALDSAGRAWREAVVGGGATAIGAAAAAGLAVAAMAASAAPPGTSDSGPRLGLPALGQRAVVLHSNFTSTRGRAALRAVVATFRAPR
ncbi:MAG TPA: LysR family transcriptional regulator [Falsiroseomonas sp.]|jgi:DNA-binding transcriptional LysR family regulator|nr:LysR family transcriptional regulator [Falsiroseomonas sp.]